MSSCSCSGVSHDEEDADFPMSSPKLTLGLSRQETTRPAYSVSSNLSLDSPFPPASVERLKPQPFRRKEPPMHFQASVRGDQQELKEWLMSGGDPNSRDDEGWALLHHASMHGREGCVQLLLRQGARHDKVAVGGHTVLHLASANRHCEVVKRLVEAGGTQLIHAKNAHGNTPLHSAAATGTVLVLSYLLSQSANPDAVNSVGETPDQVGGATAEAVHLLQAARRLKQARIAQRFALVKIHYLWNSGRAEPRNAVVSAAVLGNNYEGKYPQATVECAVVKATSVILLSAAPSPSGALSSETGDGLSRLSLESTVAGVSGLPAEVFRRIVGYCNL